MRDFWNEFVQAHDAQNPQGPFASTIVIMPASIAGFAQEDVPGNKAFADFLVALEQAGADVKVLRTTEISAAFLKDMQDYGLDPRIADFEMTTLDRIYGNQVGLMIGEADLENPQPLMTWEPGDRDLQEFVKTVTAPNSGYKIVLPQGFRAPSARTPAGVPVPAAPTFEPG